MYSTRNENKDSALKEIGEIMSDIPKFDEIVITHKGFRLVWEHIGEGFSGEYNPKDKNDTPLLY